MRSYCAIHIHLGYTVFNKFRRDNDCSGRLRAECGWCLKHILCDFFFLRVFSSAFFVHFTLFPFNFALFHCNCLLIFELFYVQSRFQAVGRDLAVVFLWSRLAVDCFTFRMSVRDLAVVFLWSRLAVDCFTFRMSVRDLAVVFLWSRLAVDCFTFRMSVRDLAVVFLWSRLAVDCFTFRMSVRDLAVVFLWSRLALDLFTIF